MIKFWHITMQFYYSPFRFGMGFTCPPTRKDLYDHLRERWIKLNEQQQNDSWELLLIMGFVPEEPWIGTITTFYGEICCTERFLIDNSRSE